MNPASQPAQVPPDTEVYTVSQLNREARRLLEAGLPLMWVAGEISNLAQPGSGHMYFTLKDDNAQVRCAMFRGANRQLRFSPTDGDQVMVQARVSIYEPRGSYQLIVEKMEAAGEGLLRQRFEELKRKLSAEGLFDAEHKVDLPDIPSHIGIVTSPTGAAIRDMLHILKRRFPAASVVIYPTRVQGNEATNEIVAALNKADQRNECDVLVVARGGGSLEDLWCFNEEAVARAIHECRIPVVSGVGHEVDFTIADLVADLRAPTPSGAAELITPDKSALARDYAAMDRRAALSLTRLLTTHADNSAHLHKRLQRMHPGTILRQLQQRTDELARQLATATRNYTEVRRLRFNTTQQRLRGATPLGQVERKLLTSADLKMRMRHSMQRRLDLASNRLALVAGNLNAVSPLATLERGYAIVRDSESGQVISSAADLNPGDKVETRLARGSFTATVNSRKQK